MPTRQQVAENVDVVTDDPAAWQRTAVARRAGAGLVLDPRGTDDSIRLSRPGCA